MTPEKVIIIEKEISFRQEMLHTLKKNGYFVPEAMTVTSNKKVLIALQAIEKAIDSDDNVLIQGEGGTGKEIIARTIHSHSIRKEKPFVNINCSLIPEKLSDSVLFGHEKGSFPGASLQKIGKLESARGGTVFLNDIDVLNFSTQQKLIESIQNKTITRIGGNNPIDTDLRIIFASNSDIKKDGLKNNFIEKIFSELSFASIIVPPLRERKEDIKQLVKHFIENNDKYKDKAVNAPVLKLFEKYNWPDNLRELFEVIEQACIISDEVIGVEHLPEYFFSPSVKTNEEISEYYLNSTETDEIIPLETVEREALIHAIKVTRGNISLAAKKLGIGRATFYRKAKAYNLKNLPLLSQKGREKSSNQ